MHIAVLSQGHLSRIVGTVLCFSAFLPTAPKCVIELTGKASHLERLVTSLHLTMLLWDMISFTTVLVLNIVLC